MSDLRETGARWGMLLAAVLIMAALIGGLAYMILDYIIWV